LEFRPQTTDPNANRIVFSTYGNIGVGTSSPSSGIHLVGKSLRVSSTFEGSGQIQSDSVVRFANGTNAQGIYVKQISVSDSWADND